jgi:hypothetical protein
MTEFERALQECLRDLELGNSDVDECLLRYPQFAQQLEPVLLTSAYLQRGSEARPTAAFKARVRTKVLQGMYTRPRKPVKSGFLFMRFAVGFAIVLLALLAAGTAYAQGALPGDPFYGWKLASENIWRSISSNPVEADLAIAERRLEELMAVNQDPTLYSQTLQAYLEVVNRLKAEADGESEGHILEVLDAQAEELSQSGIVLPPVDQALPPPTMEPTLIPISSPTAVPLPLLQTPQVDPTNLPEIVPTVDVPSNIIPTVKDPSKIIPTIEIPPSIP